jgi:Rrf2 family transcriptional regulator, nitric oxide-sensitive transcriptional repressor
MLSLTKKTDYALIALGYLAEQEPGVIVSAREIAERFGMPAALVMNIMKTLHHGKLILSTRGTKGGYRLTADLSKLSVHDLISVLEGPIRLAECIILDGDCRGKATCKLSRACPIQAPIKSLHRKMVSFLRDVPLSDVVKTGHAKSGAREAAEEECLAAARR